MTTKNYLVPLQNCTKLHVTFEVILVTNEQIPLNSNLTLQLYSSMPKVNKQMWHHAS